MSIPTMKEMLEAQERVRKAEEAHWESIMNAPQPEPIPEEDIVDFGYDYDGDEFDGSPLMREYVVTKDGEIHYR